MKRISATCYFKGNPSAWSEYSGENLTQSDLIEIGQDVAEGATFDRVGLEDERGILVMVLDAGLKPIPLVNPQDAYRALLTVTE